MRNRSLTPVAALFLAPALILTAPQAAMAAGVQAPAEAPAEASAETSVEAEAPAQAAAQWTGRDAADDAITPQDFLVLLDALGVEAQIAALPEPRDPRAHGLGVTASTDGLYWDAVFYRCGAASPDDAGAAPRIGARPVRGCRDLALSAGFDLEYPVSVQIINRFNRDYRFARAILSDEGAPVLTMDVNLEGGVSRQALEADIATWRTLLVSFAKHVGY